MFLNKLKFLCIFCKDKYNLARAKNKIFVYFEPNLDCELNLI